MGQHVIIYDGPDQADIVYSTAYNEREINDGIVRCFYGKAEATNIRSLPAAEHYAVVGAGEVV